MAECTVKMFAWFQNVSQEPSVTNQSLIPAKDNDLFIAWKSEIAATMEQVLYISKQLLF